MNQVPSFTTLAESEKFIANLQEFVIVQNEFSKAIQRIDVIENRGDSIVALCHKNIADVATAYKELVAANDFVPKFINKASAIFFNKTLDEFETVQQLYIKIVAIRNIIDMGSASIVGSKNAPKGLVPGYKQMMKYTDLSLIHI